MPLLDFVLNNTGAIGSKIRSKMLDVKANAEYQKRPPPPKRVTIITNEGKRLVLDATTDITSTFPTKVTSYPVEDRSTISDHVVNTNPTFSLSGVFSDASYDKGREHKFNQMETYDQLIGIRDKRDVVTLLTYVGQEMVTYSDLILTSLVIKRSTGQGLALYVDISFEKIRKVKNDLKKVTVGVSKNKTAVATGDAAIKTTPPVDAANKPKNEPPESIRRSTTYTPPTDKKANVSGSVAPISKGLADLMGIPSEAYDATARHGGSY